MKYLFHPQAELELNLAVEYYEDCHPNLGLEFAGEVYEALQRILLFPNAWQLLDDENRRCLINRFPFGIIYYQENGEIIILAIMQLNKKPDYWQDRVRT